MYDRILLPTDGSESMTTVYEHAADIAARRDATVHALYVVDDRAFLTLDDEMRADVAAQLRATGEEAVAAAADRLARAGVETTTEIREGNPADAILAVAREADVDLVVMGTHGDEYRSNIIGSVSRQVVLESTVPVLTVNVTAEGE
jgi:nucleotide-binding universal stress UspA family protein